MPRYQVKPGEVLPHNNQVLEAGAIVELPRIVAEDMAVRAAIQEIDAAGKPVQSPLATAQRDFERFRSHEQVTLLEREIADTEARLTELRTLLAAAVKASTSAPPATTKAAKAVEPHGDETK